MHYVGIVNGEEREIEITEIAPERYLIIMDERRFEVDGRAVAEGALSLLWDNRSYHVELDESSDGPSIAQVRGRPVPVEVLDLRRMQLRRAHESSAVADGPASISSPMPGKVVAVLVQDGQEVEEGQGLIVVEAMKMENELKAPKAGVVRELSVQEGQAVDGGKTLCVVE